MDICISSVVNMHLGAHVTVSPLSPAARFQGLPMQTINPVFLSSVIRLSEIPFLYLASVGLIIEIHLDGHMMHPKAFSRRMSNAGLVPVYSVCAEDLFLDHMCISCDDEAMERGAKVMISEFFHCAGYDALGLCSKARHSHAKRIRPIRALPSAFLYLNQLLNRCAH